MPDRYLIQFNNSGGLGIWLTCDWRPTLEGAIKLRDEFRKRRGHVRWRVHDSQSTPAVRNA